MTRAPSHRAAPALLSLLAFALGCSSSPDEPSRNLEVFSWWVNPGEKAAFDGVIASYQQQHPKTNILRSSPSSAALSAAQISTRMSSGSPPDVFQSFGGTEVLRWVLSNGQDDS